jgi:hypothetical protein
MLLRLLIGAMQETSRIIESRFVGKPLGYADAPSRLNAAFAGLNWPLPSTNSVRCLDVPGHSHFLKQGFRLIQQFSNTPVFSTGH